MNTNETDGRRLHRWMAVLPAVMLVATACGSRMDRTDIQAAERRELAASAASLAQTAGGALPAGVGSADSGMGGAVSSGSDTGNGAPTSGGSSGSQGRGTAGTSAIGGAGFTTGTGGTKAGGATGSGFSASSAGTKTSAGPSGGAGAGAATADKGAATTAGTGVAASTGPANKAPVAVGSVATLSGPLGAFTKDYIFAVGVWVKWKNAHGGVSGHPVRHLVADDGGDPARYNAAVRQMVEEQGVVAFVHNTIGFAGGDLSYITQKRVPVIGHEGGIDAAYESPFVFTPAPSGSTYAYSAISALASVLVPAGKTKLGVMACSDVKLCDTFDKVYMGSAKDLGFDVVYHARPSLTQPDFTGECISARQAGAEVLLVSLDNNSALRVGRSCTRQNYKPVLGLLDNVIVPSVAEDPVMEGSLIATKAPAWPATDLPGLAEIHQAFASAAPGVQVDGAHVNGWVSAKTFEVATRNLADKVTPEDVLNGLWSINGDDLGGLTYPLAFPKMQNSPKKACWSAVQIRQRKFVPAESSTLSCK